MEIDLRLVLSAIGLVISVASFWVAFEARKEAKQTAMLELAHQKRMLITTQFSDVARVVRALRNEKFDDTELARSYDQIEDYRNRLIEAMNKSTEMNLDIDKLDKKFLLNEISDFNLMYSIHKAQIVELEEYLANKTIHSTSVSASD